MRPLEKPSTPPKLRSPALCSPFFSRDHLAPTDRYRRNPARSQHWYNAWTRQIDNGLAATRTRPTLPTPSSRACSSSLPLHSLLLLCMLFSLSHSNERPPQTSSDGWRGGGRARARLESAFVAAACTLSTALQRKHIYCVTSSSDDYFIHAPPPRSTFLSLKL